MHNKKGFTLIELLVVIAIIGLLSTLAVVALNNARQKARDARRLSDVKQIQTALELFYNDANGYPTAVSPGNSLAYSGTTYMAQVPTSPNPGDGTCATPSPYTYQSVGTWPFSTYRLQYCLGSAVNDIKAGFNTASPAGIAE